MRDGWLYSHLKKSMTRWLLSRLRRLEALRCASSVTSNLSDSFERLRSWNIIPRLLFVLVVIMQTMMIYLFLFIILLYACYTEILLLIRRAKYFICNTTTNYRVFPVCISTLPWLILTENPTINSKTFCWTLKLS